MFTEKKSWVKDLLVAFAATTLSIIMTFGTTRIVNYINQEKERRLTVLIVMSSIERFARDLEFIERGPLARKDSIATWLLDLSVEEVASLGDEPFIEASVEVFTPISVIHDKTSEIIYSSSIDTWKNMGNFLLINNLGNCFSMMDFIEQHFNNVSLKISEVADDFVYHPEKYTGSTITEKRLQNEEMRKQLETIHYLREWICYQIAKLRETNRFSMMSVGINEEDVMQYMSELDLNFRYETKSLKMDDFFKPYPDFDSLKMRLSYALQIDSLLKVKDGTLHIEE